MFSTCQTSKLLNPRKIIEITQKRAPLKLTDLQLQSAHSLMELYIDTSGLMCSTFSSDYFLVLIYYNKNTSYDTRQSTPKEATFFN